MSKFHDGLVKITQVNSGEMYEWSLDKAYYHPERRMYYHGSGSGCSCNHYEVESAVSESDGLRKEELLSRFQDLPVKTDADEWYDHGARPEDKARALNAIRDFKEPDNG